MNPDLHHLPKKLSFPILIQNPEDQIESNKLILDKHLLSLSDYSEKHHSTPSEHAIMTDKVHEIMKTQNLADITLVGFVIKLLRTHQKMTFKELADEVSKCYGTLRRSDGSKYEGDMVKALRGCLTSSNIFKEVKNDIWSIRESEARIYEENASEKLRTLLTKKKKPRGRKADGMMEKNKGVEGNMRLDLEGSEDGDEDEKGFEEKKKSRKKTKKPIDKYNMMYNLLDTSYKALKDENGTSYMLKNPFRGLKGNENPKELWQKLGSEKFIGMLQCFEYFSPIIEEYIKDNTQKANQKNNKSTDSVGVLKAGLSDLSKKIITLEKQLKNIGQNENNSS